MGEHSARFHTQTTDDDFCEVIVQPVKEPVIDDTPPDQASTSSSSNKTDVDLQAQDGAPSSQESQTTENGDGKQTEKDEVQDDVFVAAKETEDEIEKNDESNGEVDKNGKSQESGAA